MTDKNALWARVVNIICGDKSPSYNHGAKADLIFMVVEKPLRARIATLERRISECDDARDWLIERNRTLDARIAELEAVMTDVTVNLIGAISLLESGGKKAAPSNKMFDQMLVDYKNGVERARAALKGEKDV